MHRGSGDTSPTSVTVRAMYVRTQKLSRINKGGKLGVLTLWSAEERKAKAKFKAILARQRSFKLPLTFTFP